MQSNSKFFEKRIGGSFHYQNKWMDLYADKIRENIFFKYVEVEGKKILDFGCGDGSWGMKFAIRGAKRVYGVEQTKKLAENCLHTCFYPELKNVPLSAGKMDLITGFTSFQFTVPSKRVSILKDCLRLLKKGGELAILDILPDTVPDYQKNLPYKHVWDFNTWRQIASEVGFDEKGYRNVSWVDTTIFHYFGGNPITFAITYFLDRFFMFKPKYRLLVFTKK